LVPHFLPAEQKERSVEIATLLKQRFNVETPAFLCRIVAFDETWVRDFELPIPCYSKNFDERNQRSSKLWSLLTNTDESWWRLWPICWVNTSGKCYLTRHTVQTFVHRTWLISQLKRAHALTPCLLPGRGYCSGYASHPRTEQKWHSKWNSTSSETLWRGHWEAGGYIDGQ